MRKRIWIIILFAAVAFCHGCATAPSLGPGARVMSLKNLCRETNVQWQWDSVSQVVTLSRGEMTANVLVGSNIVVVNDQRIALIAAVERRQGIVYVPSDFKAKIIDRLTRGMDYSLRKFNTIVIDAGHGGKDPGAIGVTGLEEKDVVLDIAKRLKRILEREGVEAIMTRDRDEFVPLEERARIANSQGADLFVSIHVNASHYRGANGLEVYYLRELDRAEHKELYQSKSYEDMFARLKMEKDNPVLDKILLDMLYTYKQAQSRDLAEYISSNTAEDMHSENRGHKSAGFFVLKNTFIPAVLAEVGFLSNRKEEKLFKDSSHRQAIAECLAKSILSYVDTY